MPHRTLPSNGGERNLLRLWMCPGNFHQLDFAVKSHHLDSVIGSIFNLRHLLTRICIDNPFWRYPETLHQLNFSLKKKRLHCKLLINARSRITGKLSHHSPLYLYQHLPPQKRNSDLPRWEYQGRLAGSFPSPVAGFSLTLLAQSNPVPMAARVFSTVLLSLHLTA